MHVTYLIGNGFDLACGLKTKYVDSYAKYCISPSKNETIKNFKEDILKIIMKTGLILKWHCLNSERN